jgi:DNA-binding FadR family transcriptional regulator
VETNGLIASLVERQHGGEFYALVSGERWTQHGAPARTAWEIERLAVQRGWPVGELLGSETWLRSELHVSRETLREAIRIVESRGAMQMRRGRSGGLMLTQPQIARTAAALATYLRAIGITADQIARSVRGLDQLLARQLARWNGPLPAQRIGEPVRHWLARASGQPAYLLYVAALDALSPPESARQVTPAALRDAVARRDSTEILERLAQLPFASARNQGEMPSQGSTARAASVAIGMVERAKARGETDLGNEATLCDAFYTSRSVIRQALRILQDLDMIQVRLGRGGGYVHKRPSPIGIIRQLFPWLAAEHSCPFGLMDVMWELNVANLRLAGEQLAKMAGEERALWFDRLDDVLREIDGSQRFVRLQQTLAEIADSPLIDTLARCIVCYQARSHGDVPHDLPPDMFLDRERDIIAALRNGDLDRGEAVLRGVQEFVEDITLQSFGLRHAAE